MFRRVALLCLLSVAPVAAQTPYLAMAPLRLSVDALASGEAWTASLGVDRSVPLFFFLPNVGRSSHVDFMALSAGIRSVDGTNTFRYRITTLDLAITRPPGAGGIRLLSYDRSGTRDVVADWIGIHGGPDARISLGAVIVEPRIVLAASLASRRTGHAFFPDLGPEAAGGAFGGAGSLAGELTIVLNDGVRIEGSAGVERFSSGPKPEHRHARAAVHATIATRFELIARIGIERAIVASATSDATFAGFGIRFTPAAQAY